MENKQIEEMKTALNSYFDNTPMELSFKHENGDMDIITDEKALGVLDSITRQALIPVFCQALYNAGYRKASVVAREISQDIIEPIWNAYKNSTCQETVLLVALICETINNQLKKKYTESEKDK